MNTQRKETVKQMLRFTLVSMLIVFFFGCAAGRNAELEEAESRHIIDIAISETTDSVLFIISADRSLQYSAEKQISPLGVVLRFGDTRMDIFERVYFPPENEVIRSVTADEVIEDNTATSYIFIELKKDAPYDVTTAGNAVHVAFSMAPVFSKAVGAKNESAAAKPVSELAPSRVVAATRMQQVTVTAQKNNIVVKVDANGRIKNFKRFSMRDPARIVVDIYGLKSPHKREKVITVESAYLKQIRYFGHPNKVRLVLETHPQYLSNYSLHSSDSGLIIRIGGDKATATSTAPRRGKSEITLGDHPGGRPIMLKWDHAPNATSYNLYWRNSPGVNKRNGKKITNIENPVKISGLKAGHSYYFVVTTVSGTRESNISKEMSFTVDE